MKLSEDGLAFIARHEGLRLKAYRDAVGVWTIGYGHTSRAGPPSVHAGLKISKAQALDILARDVARFEVVVERDCGHLQPLNQNEFDALVSFAFNLGPGNLRKLVKGRDRATVAAKMLQYDKAAGRRLKGLTKRRKQERALFLSPARKSHEAGHQPNYRDVRLDRRRLDTGAKQRSSKLIGRCIGAFFVAVIVAIGTWLGLGS